MLLGRINSNCKIIFVSDRYYTINIMCIYTKYIYRRKFRSQISDNIDRWKSRGGKSQRGEEQKSEDKRRERVRRKKMQVRKKVGRSPKTVFSNDLWLRGAELVSLKRECRVSDQPLRFQPPPGGSPS